MILLHFEGLRKKIIKNYFTIIIITVILFEGLFMFYVQNYYYDYVSQILKSEANNINRQYNNNIVNEADSFENKVNAILQKENKINAILQKEHSSSDSKFAISIIDKNSKMIIDQYGFKTNVDVNGEDISRALKDENNLTPYVYKIPETGEHVMSISVPLKTNNIIEGVVRYTISLEEIDSTIFRVILGLVLA